jgi:colanic acid/amylovoran biosynthesis glycosyltransferase
MARTESSEPQLRIAYLCSLYPAISHTFIMREVDALRSLGAEIATFSIHRAGPEHINGDADRAAAAGTFAILPPRLGTLLGAHARAALGHPSAYVRTLMRSLGLARSGLAGRIWQLFYFAEAMVLWRECDEKRVRHVHAHLANVAADVALLAAAFGSAVDRDSPWSWSFTMHGPTELFAVDEFRLAKKVRHASFVICISDFTRSQLMMLCDSADWEKLHVVHCGIPLQQFTRRARPTAINGHEEEQEPMLLYVGRLVPEKGQAVLLEALSLLRRRGVRVRATLVGEGPERGRLEALADRLGVRAHAHFTGALGQEGILALYERATAFCLPSFAEGVPCVLMEAMAMEIPVVSTFVAGIPELVENERTGLLVAPGRADLLADAIERLIADPQLRHRLGTQGAEKVAAEFSSQSTAEDLHAVFTARIAAEARPG